MQPAAGTPSWANITIWTGDNLGGLDLRHSLHAVRKFRRDMLLDVLLKLPSTNPRIKSNLFCSRSNRSR